MSELEEARKEATLIKLRKAIMEEYPVTISKFLNNYVNMFQDTIKPEEFGCSTMDSFITKISIEKNIWKTSYIYTENENKLVIKPTRKTFLKWRESERRRMGIQEIQQPIPEDAVFQVGFPPLDLPNLTVDKDFPVVVTDILSLEKIWFNIYHPECHGALQSLMVSLNQFYNSEAGDCYKVQNIRELKVGSVLVARYKQGEFHRVVLRAILNKDKLVRLEYVDFGSVASQSVSKCRYLAPQFLSLPGQALKARLWGITAVPDAKTKQGQTLTEKLIDMLYNDCAHGSLLAVVKSMGDPMAVEFYDAFRAGGLNIGSALVQLGLAKTGEASEDIKCRKERGQSYVIKVPRKVQETVRKDTDRISPSWHLQLLRQYEAVLSSMLDQVKMEAAGVGEKDSSRHEEIEEKLIQYQVKLKEVKERRNKKAKEEEI